MVDNFLSAIFDMTAQSLVNVIQDTVIKVFFLLFLTRFALANINSDNYTIRIKPYFSLV